MLRAFFILLVFAGFCQAGSQTKIPADAGCQKEEKRCTSDLKKLQRGQTSVPQQDHNH